MSDRTIAGIAVPFDNLSTDLGGFRERFTSGSVDATLRPNTDIRALAHHDSGRLLARISAGTLRLRKEQRGLGFEIDLPRTTDGNDVLELVKRRDLTGMSFSFSKPQEEWDFSGPVPIRTITGATFHEVSPVSWPAYESSQVAVQQRGAVVSPSGRSISWLQKLQKQAAAR